MIYKRNNSLLKKIKVKIRDKGKIKMDNRKIIRTIFQSKIQNKNTKNKVNARKILLNQR